MNTERPDNDDAEARAFGSARDTGGASADGAESGTPQGGPRDDAATSGSSPGAPASETDGARGPEGDIGDAEADGDRALMSEPSQGGLPADGPSKAPRAGTDAPEADDAPTGPARTDDASTGTAAADGGQERDAESGTEKAHGDESKSAAPGAPSAGSAGADAAKPDGTEDRAVGSEHAHTLPAQDGEAVAEGPEAGSSAIGAPGADASSAPATAAAGADEAEAEAEPSVARAAADPVPGAGDGAAPDAGEGRTGTGRGAGGGSGDAHDDDDGHGVGRRRSPGLVAAVAAAVLLVGGGGAYLAASASGGPGGGTTPGADGDGTPPPLTLDAYAEGGTHGIAPGEPNPYGAAYRADGPLPEGPGSAPVYRARGKITEAQVAGLAKALEVDGKPVAEGDAWRIGGKDGSGPTLRVDRGAPGTWTFSRYTPGPDACTGKDEACGAPSAGDAPAVSEEAAKKAAAPVLKALGQDDAKLDVGQVMGVKRVVNAEPEVGGLPTYGWTTGVVVGAGGEVVGGSGRLSAPVKADTYPVVGAEEALKLLNTAPGAGERAEIGGCATPVPLESGDRQEQQEPCATASTLPAEDTVVVEKAVFGLAAHAVDGQQALVPSWLFEVRPTKAQDGGTVTYPAVEPEYLAPRARSGETGTQPAKPGDGDRPTSAPAGRDVAVEGYTAEGSELTVTFTGGVCADYEATADESGGRVTVTVTETPWPDKVCIMIAKQYQQTVRLDAPLAAREVVDADGEPVPLHKDGARLPAPPSER